MAAVRAPTDSANFKEKSTISKSVFKETNARRCNSLSLHVPDLASKKKEEKKNFKVVEATCKILTCLSVTIKQMN